MPATPSVLLPRAYYCTSIGEFLGTIPETILGILTENSEFSVDLLQRDAWHEQIRILKSVLIGLAGTIFFEFTIPRMGRRIDVVIISGPIIFVIEFKIGEHQFQRDHLYQVWDYALDLKNFHEASHSAPILPILVATQAVSTEKPLLSAYEDNVYAPVAANSESLRVIINLGLRTICGSPLDCLKWLSAPYHPTPTIIEAAQTLYAQHSVEAIARHDAGARNLRITSQRIETIITEARQTKRKVICFVTGVPGAGKTLVGLNVATQRRDPTQPTHAVFLSGNGPLVAVLREALIRDEHGRRRDHGERIRKSEIGENVKVFIQNVHHFRDDALRDSRPPIDHVVIFDEAQRAWNADKTSFFMRTKKKSADFSMSEPEFLISYMDRHPNWAVIICLVGGGQEINTGEAGISAWIDAMINTFSHWHVSISADLADSEYAAGHVLESIRSRKDVVFEQDLHLSVSMRSFRAENVSAFVKSLLDCDESAASKAFKQLQARYPIALTRDLDRAKSWIKEHARGSERFGLVASSEAQRLKPHAIDVRMAIDPVHWFLNPRDDTRSSYYMEDAATEFQVQGLELDWVCVAWDGDLRFKHGTWVYHSFCGNAWRRILKTENQNYLRNAYRVLLTRARQGMVIFVPPGSADDPTRAAVHYDSTFHYLKKLGIQTLEL